MLRGSCTQYKRAETHINIDSGIIASLAVNVILRLPETGIFLGPMLGDKSYSFRSLILRMKLLLLAFSRFIPKSDQCRTLKYKHTSCEWKCSIRHTNPPALAALETAIVGVFDSSNPHMLSLRLSACVKNRPIQKTQHYCKKKSLNLKTISIPTGSYRCGSERGHDRFLGLLYSGHVAL